MVSKRGQLGLMNCAFLLVLLSQTVPMATATELVLFAGPHKSAATSVENFLYEYASGHHRFNADGSPIDAETKAKTYGLRDWRWPRIYGKVANETNVDEPYKIFGNLVTDPDNEVLRNEILEGIREFWHAQYISGVVVGTEEFDQVGIEAHYDGLYAMKRIVDYLSAEPEEVTVALNYRVPRASQWGSMWAHTYLHHEEVRSYEEWLCDRESLHTHMGVLGTAMNPLNAALAFVEEGWTVKMVDMSGVDDEERDISHVVACYILGGHCEKGNLKKHLDDKPHMNAANTGLTALTEAQLKDVERLFQYRDCAFADELADNPKFNVIFNRTVFADCDPSKKEIYEKLRSETSYMYKALLSQVTCPEGNPIKSKHMVTMKEALSGKISEYASSFKSTEQLEEQLAPKRGRSGAGGFIQFVLFVSLAGGAVAYQYKKMQTSRPMRGFGFGEAELSAVRKVSDDDAEYGDADAGEEGGFRDVI